MIKQLVAGLWFALFVGFCSAADQVAADSFDFQAVKVGAVISLYLKEVSQRPYMICSDVLADERMVSVRARGKTLTGPLFFSLLAEHGYAAVDRSGVLTVCKKKEMEELGEWDSFLYRVKHRDPAYLVDLVSPLVKGIFANKRTTSGALSVGDKNGQAPSVAAQQTMQSGGAAIGSTFNSLGDDYILFSGTDKEIGKLKKLLDQVDVPTGEIVLKAYMYEVGSTDSDASALSLLMSALGGKLQLGVAGSTLGDFIRLKTSSIDLVASALKSDGRFKVVTAPYQRVRSGKSARFVSGSQVSVLGAIVTNQSGTTQQSFDRIESGTILEISPVVRGDGIDVDVFQQVSSFVKTDSSSQPTLNKRELRTSLSVKDGEVVVIAGLDDSKEERSKAGFSFLPFSLSSASSSSRSQLILVLEVTRI